MSEKDQKRPSRKRTSPGRSKAFHYGDFDLDGDSDAALAVALAASQSTTSTSEELDFQTSLETSQLGAATAKHEHIQLPPSPDSVDQQSDESKAQDIIGSFFKHCDVNKKLTSIYSDVLVANDMLYEITIKGMKHLQLAKSSYLEEVCTARRRKNQLFQVF